MEETKAGCARPPGGASPPVQASAGGQGEQEARKEAAMSVRAGQKAPDFEATAWFEGKFQRMKLSDYAGKWILLCFYPGDFTFV